MPEFLSDDWIAGLDAAAQSTQVPDALSLVIQQVVVLGDGAEQAFAIRINGGRVSVQRGRADDADDADVTFTQDAATAAAITQGALSAQAAFIAGRLRVGGDLRTVIDQASGLAATDDVFATVRATTTW